MPKGMLGHYAGFASRFVALVIDGLLISVSLSGVAWALIVATDVLQFNQLLNTSTLPYLGFLDPARWVTPAVISIVSFLYLVIYHLFFWVSTGQTPGKALMGVRVLSLKGTRLTILEAMLRLAGYLISALPLYAGFLWILIDDRRQGWHDKLAGSCVVYAWAARPDERFLAQHLDQFAPDGSPRRLPEQRQRND